MEAERGAGSWKMERGAVPEEQEAAAAALTASSMDDCDMEEEVEAGVASLPLARVGVGGGVVLGAAFHGPWLRLRSRGPPAPPMPISLSVTAKKLVDGCHSACLHLRVHYHGARLRLLRQNPNLFARRQRALPVHMAHVGRARNFFR